MQKALGPETNVVAEVVNGKIKLSVVYAGKQVGAEAAISSESDLLVDALLALIPGDSAFEKVMGDLLKTALRSVTV